MPHKKDNNAFFFNLPDFEKQAEEAKIRAKTPPAPSFSLDDMDEARKTAFEQGRQEGTQQAKDSIEQRTEILIQSIVDNVHTLQQGEIEREKAYIKHATEVSSHALQKLLKTILKAEQETLMEQALTNFFKDQKPTATLSVFVHPSMASSVKKYVEMMGNDIALHESQDLHPTQARVEWDTGEFNFNPEQLVEQILSIVQNYDEIAAQTLDESIKKPHNEGIMSQSLPEDEPKDTQE